jgi:hypothetical protein
MIWIEYNDNVYNHENSIHIIISMLNISRKNLEQIMSILSRKENGFIMIMIWKNNNSS